MEDIKVSPRITIRDAMEILDRTAKKILLVVEDAKLIGTLTDGDIRRHILKHHDLTGSIENAFNSKPYTVFYETYDLEKVKKTFTQRDINLIPIVNKNKILVDYITIEKAFGKKKQKQKQKLDASVVIMAGGKGTRLKPFTNVLPKPLIPVGDKTVVDHIIDKFVEYGINDFYLTINYMSKIIQAYFEEKSPDYKIGFAHEEEPRGTAGSLTLIKDSLKTPFFVSNCDVIIEADYSDIYQFHEKGCHDITLVAAAKQFHIPYGVCELEKNGGLGSILEKPEYNFLVNTGLYVLNPDSLNLIPENGLFHMTHLIEKVKEEKGTVGVYPVSEKSWVDVGQWEEYRSALKMLEGI